MSALIPVALLGFSSFERSALASYLRLAPKRNPGYEQVLSIDDAQFVIADADESGVPELLAALGRTQDAVFIGAHGPQDSAVWMMRPIDPAQVLLELDSLLARRDNPATGPLPLMGRSKVPAQGASPTSAAAPDLARARRADDGAADRAQPQVGLARPASPVVQAGAVSSPQGPQDAPVASGATAEGRRNAAARRERREAALQPVTLRRALLVDDSEVALAFLERQLHRHGIDADWAISSNKAIDLMSQRPYGMVFVDIDLGERSDMDGLALCQHIKRRHVHAGGRAPMVALVSAFNDSVDRVRGTLAGADGHLGKPLDVAALDRLLQAHGLGGLDSVSGGLPSR